MQQTINDQEKIPYYHGYHGDRLFCSLNAELQESVSEIMGSIATPALFTVDTAGLFDVYLNSFKDPAERQHHNCTACRQFINKYGGLVTIHSTVNKLALLWQPNKLGFSIPPSYHLAITNLKNEVESRIITNQFFWTGDPWGVEEAGGFHHFYVNPRREGPGSRGLTPNQKAAESVQNFVHLSRALFGDQSFSLHSLKLAIDLLNFGGLHYPEKLLPMARFLLDAKSDTIELRGDQKKVCLWFYVASAPPGWCTPRGSALGALLSDLSSGKSMEEAGRAHNARVDPQTYQRPKAAPTLGNIKQAEELVEKLNLRASFRRRLVSVDEVQALWMPREAEKPIQTEKLFSELEAQAKGISSGKPMVSVTQTQITLSAFVSTVLPQAFRLQVMVPPRAQFAAITTADDPNAEPIIKWDYPDNRNPYAWYIWGESDGRTPHHWNLKPYEYVDVLKWCKLPPEWTQGNKYDHITLKRHLAVLKGARESVRMSSALFPEILKSELHGVRSTIEAYSNQHALDDVEGQQASGVLMGSSAIRVRAELATCTVEYIVVE